MSTLNGIEPLGLEEYDTPETQTATSAEPLRAANQSHNGASFDPSDATQMEENLGVEDLGVDDVLQTKVRRPLPKLDAKRLLNPHRGYPFLLEHLKKIEYRGKGDEKRYLKKYVNTYLIWANRLWPKANFDDFTVLARKAGKDPRIRQYCRELIEEEKYGGSPAQGTADPLSSSLLHPDSQPTAANDSGANGSGSTEGARDAEPIRNEAAPPPSEWEQNEAASPPPEWEQSESQDLPASDSSPHDAVGPNEDEEAAALELYGDLDM